MKYDYVTSKNGTRYCNVFVDKTSSHGILRCSHEINVTFILKNNKWVFDSAWHIGVSDMEWDSSEEDSFEDTFPGLLEEMKKGLKL